jgi:tetratricopeptide (TPR) repeat protein
MAPRGTSVVRPAARLLVTLVLLVGLPLDARAGWVRLQTANFLFLGNASERQVRQVARKLEQFREVTLRALPGATARSPVPTIVIVFAGERSFGPFKPRIAGRTAQAAGYFLGDEDLNYIAVNLASGNAGFSTIFHEYSHFLVRNMIGTVPIWLSEGLAQFYESFEAYDEGRRAVVGLPLQDQLALLRERKLLPLRELLAAEVSSPMYHHEIRRDLFYAQSWALTHYLVVGNAARRPQFVRYLSLLRRGVSPSEAVDAAFPDVDRLDGEIRKYVRGFRLTSLPYTFDERITDNVAVRGQPIDALEADAYLGDLQARINRIDEARARLERVRARKPDAARATAALGLIEQRAGRLSEAIALFERAAVDEPDDAHVQGALGRALMARLGDQSPDSDEYGVTVREARTALTRAATLDPGRARTTALLGYAEFAAGEDLERSAALLEEAVRLAPAREQYRLMLAEVLLRRQALERATALLGPLVAGPNRPDLREPARQLLALVAAARAQSAAETVPGR